MPLNGKFLDSNGLSYFWSKLKVKLNAKQDTLSASNKLDPNFINYDSTHRAVTDTEKSTWNSKQSALTTTQLSAVNSGITEDKVTAIGELTVLEEEDRAALAEIVDSGAKNKLNTAYANTQTRRSINGITFTKLSDGGYAATGTSTSVSRLMLTQSDPEIGYVSVADYSGLFFTCLTSNGSNTTFSADAVYYDSNNNYLGEQHDYGNGFVVSPTQGATKVVLRISIFTAAGSNINLVFKPMICTKAAWDISQKFVPYKQPVDDHLNEIDQRLATVSTQHFGFKIDKNNSDPTTNVTYTHDAVGMTPVYMDYTNDAFNYGSWKDVWFIKNAYPVALTFDGREDYKLDPDDYSKKSDGTTSDVSNSSYQGNFMMAFPIVWFKRYEDSSYNYIEIADKNSTIPLKHLPTLIKMERSNLISISRCSKALWWTGN